MEVTSRILSASLLFGCPSQMTQLLNGKIFVIYYWWSIGLADWWLTWFQNTITNKANSLFLFELLKTPTKMTFCLIFWNHDMLCMVKGLLDSIFKWSWSVCAWKWAFFNGNWYFVQLESFFTLKLSVNFWWWWYLIG